MYDYSYEDREKSKRQNTNKNAAEKVLQRYGLFLEDYGLQLLRIQKSLNESFNIIDTPVALKLKPKENTSVLELIDTDNKVLNKMLIVFTTLCLEVDSLESEGKQKYLNEILYYGEGSEFCNTREEPQLLISKLLPILQDVISFIKRCNQVLVHIVQQIAAFYTFSSENPKIFTAADVHLQEVFEHIGKLLTLIITFDEIINSHVTIKDHFSIYQDTVQAAIQDTDKFNMDVNKLVNLDKMLMDIEKNLLRGKLFYNSLHLPFEKRIPIKKHAVLADEFSLYIKTSCSRLEMNILANKDVMCSWLKTCATYVLSIYLFGSTDKKLFKHVWEISKKIPCVTIYGSIMWFPDKFLQQYLGHLTKQIVDTKTQEAVDSSRTSFVSQSVQTLTKKVQMFSFQMFSWTVQIEVCLQQDLCNFKSEDMKIMCNLLCEGVQLSSKMQCFLNTLTNLHGALGKPMTKSCVIILCKLVENVKAMQYMYSRHSVVIAKAVHHMIQRFTFQALSIIATVKKNLIQDKRFSEKHVDILSSLVITEKTLNGPPTKQRMLITRLAISLANRQRTFREEELTNLNEALEFLSSIANLDDHLNSATNCNFLYWHRVILPIYFSHLYETKTDLSRVKYVVKAVQDFITDTNPIPESMSVLKTYLDQEVTDYLNTQIIKPACEEIETNLRLQTHSHLQQQKCSLNTIRADPKSLLHTSIVHLFHKYLNFKGHIENYLEHIFYDLTTVALHNWRSYGEMRRLAQHKYKLDTIDDKLPSQTLEQGLDVLEIMRNIHIFVMKYYYNLNNQIFIEHSTNNKNYNTISIKHIANSIRTHGTGIMNTTVNFTYQFLRKKLNIFSEFLYDEHIKSRLLKDQCYFRDNKTQLDSKYPYERADRFNKGIRKLNKGVSDNGLTYLDQFRLLITYIGNALGYVRMIRSGGLHFCSNTVSFIPDLDNIIPLEDMCLEENLSRDCADAAKSLDTIINNMSRSLTEGTEYFKLLVDVFATELRNPKNIHLRNFHIIIPPLTINFVEHLIINKEKMNRKSKTGGAFTDDGFAMGVAYLLKVLDLNHDFDSLHWFQTVNEKYNLEKEAINKQGKIESREDDKLQQTLNLTSKRLDTYQQEFTLLYYSLSSARIFFQKEQITTEEVKRDAKE